MRAVGCGLRGGAAQDAIFGAGTPVVKACVHLIRPLHHLSRTRGSLAQSRTSHPLAGYLIGVACVEFSLAYTNRLLARTHSVACGASLTAHSLANLPLVGLQLVPPQQLAILPHVSVFRTPAARPSPLLCS